MKCRAACVETLGTSTLVDGVKCYFLCTCRGYTDVILSPWPRSWHYIKLSPLAETYLGEFGSS